jgi:molecular chaperone DnaK
MKKDAEANADADKVSRERAEKLNADGMIFQTETQLKELGEKLSDENKVAVEYALTELRMAHQDILQFKLH